MDTKKRLGRPKTKSDAVQIRADAGLVARLRAISDRTGRGLRTETDRIISAGLAREKQ